MFQISQSRARHFVFTLVAVTIVTAWLSLTATAKNVDDSPILLPEGRGLVVQGFLKGKSKGAAQDLSGIACRPPAASGELLCLIVNDEGLSAQPVVIDNGRLTPGEPQKLIDGDPPTAVLGVRPTVDCPRKAPAEFKEFDGEGVAFAPGPAGTDGYFYVVGSHGCSRKKDEFRQSSFLLARLPVDPFGKFGKAELTWRVSEALSLTPQAISAKIGRSLSKDDGLNIEGIAAIGDRLLFGLRAPTHDAIGYVVSILVAQLFAPGTGAAASGALVHELPLEKDTGIRDLASLPDGKLLVLTGPKLDQASVPYALSVYDFQSNHHRWLGRLGDISSGGDRAKAEAVVVLSQADDELRVLVLFDGVQNGGPQEYRLQY